MPLDIGDSVTFTDDTIIVGTDSSHETPGSWIVERSELASEDAITESYFERNPAFRNATVYPAPQAAFLWAVSTVDRRNQSK